MTTAQQILAATRQPGAKPTKRVAKRVVEKMAGHTKIVITRSGNENIDRDAEDEWIDQNTTGFWARVRGTDIEYWFEYPVDAIVFKLRFG